MIRRGRTWCWTVLLLGGLSCGGEGPDDLPLIEIGEQSMTVLSPDDGSLWDVKDVLEAGGVFWALKASPPFLHGFDASGNRVATFGTPGQGPGELRYPRAIWPAGAVDAVTVWDAGSTAALTFSASGEFLSSHRMPRLGGMRADIETVTFGQPFRLFRNGGTTVVGQFDSGVTHGIDLWRGKLVRVADEVRDDREIPVGEVIFDFAGDLSGYAERPSPQAPGLVPVPLWDGCPDGRIAVFDPIARTVHVVGPSEDDPQAIRLPWEPVALRRSDKFAYIHFQIATEARGEGVVGELVDRMAESALAEAEDFFPADAPAGVDLKCASSRVWIQEFDGDSHPLGYGPYWRTVALDGSVPRFARVGLPRGFQPVRVSSSGMLGVVTDAVSIQRLAQVDLPPELR